MEHFALPNDVGQLTPELLTAVLRHNGHLANGRVSTVAAERIGEGVGMISQLAVMTLGYEGDRGELPDTMVAKFTTPFAENKALVQFYGFYRNEAGCYRQAESSGLGVPVPRVYAAEVSDDGGETLILMADLSGGRLSDQIAGASRADAEAVIDTAAALHATWWESPELHTWDWLRPVNNEAFKRGEDQYQQVWPLFADRYADRVPETALAIAERHGHQIRDYYDWAMVNVPLTLAHTDFRLDNFMFDLPGAPVTVIDWQLTVRGVGVQDISYFIVQSLTADDRRAFGEALLRRWHDGLIERGVRSYSWNDALTDFRRCVLTQLPIAVVGSTTLDAANERGQLLMDTLVDRNLQALVEYDCHELHLE